MRNLRSRVVVLAGCTIGMLGVTADSVAGGHAARDRMRCAQPLAALEQSWGGTGAWRRLAPYPVPREASPTDSIGVWLERSYEADGAIALRRVSVSETVVARIAGAECDVQFTTHRRAFDSSAMASAFTDASLIALLRRTDSGVIYVWSPRMPLSVRGLDEARAAARMLGMAFTDVVAEDSLNSIHAHNSLNSLELVYRNATIHYPSVIFYRRGKLLGSAVPGYKQRDTYASLAREAVAESEERSAGVAERRDAPTTAPTFWVDHAARVSTTRTVPTVRLVGFFFKPVANTDLVSYTSQGKSFLFDLGTRQEKHIPGNVDPVPTPDGRFVMRPGLMFYPVSTLAAGDTTPVFVDRDLPDEYQTASILSTSKTAVRYRVVTGWRMGARIRDYEVSLDHAGRTRIQPLGQPSVPCPDREFSLPISAKGSKEIGVYDKTSRTNRIIAVTDAGACVDVLDLGFASGKLSFSYDGRAIAFATSRINVDAEGTFLKPEETFYKDALILYRATGRIVSLSANRPLSGMTFPEFLPDGRSIILDQSSRLRPTEVFRVVEVK